MPSMLNFTQDYMLNVVNISAERSLFVFLDLLYCDPCLSFICMMF